MRSLAAVALSFLVGFSVQAAEKCIYVLHPLTEIEAKWVQVENSRPRLIAAFYDTITSFQSARSTVREEMENTKMLSAFAELKKSTAKGLEVIEGNAENFKNIHRDEIPTRNYAGEKYQVTYVRHGQVILFIYKTDDPFTDVYTVRIFRSHGSQWRKEGGLEVRGPNAMIASTMYKFAEGIRSVLGSTRFFASSDRAVVDVLEILQLATGRDFTPLKNVAVPMVIKSDLVGGSYLTAVKFRQQLMRLVQVTIDQKRSFRKVIGDDTQTFAILTGAELQKTRSYQKYSFVKTLNPQHEYFVSEDPGAVRLMVVDLTLGRTTGEIKMIRQADDELPLVLHIDGMDRPVGEIDAIDSNVIHVNVLHDGFFRK